MQANKHHMLFTCRAVARTARALVAAFACAAIGNAVAADWEVWPETKDGMTGPQQVTNALTRLSAGDTILVNPGTYDFTGISMRTDRYEKDSKVYVITNHLQREIDSYKIVGQTDGHWNDAVVFKGNGRCLDSHKGDVGVYSKVTVRNITFEGFSCNDYPSGDCLQSRGGAMRLTDNDLNNDIVSNCVIRNCRAYIGAAVNGGALYDCLVTNNVATDSGGCGCNTFAKGCRIVENRAGGAYGALYGGSFGVADSAFINNTAASYCGAVSLGGDAIVTNCLFRGNACANASDGRGAALYLATSGNAVKVVDCRFEHNLAGQNGGAIYLGAANATPSIAHCTFVGNSAQRGGAVYVAQSSPVPITDCVFVGNVCSVYGGAIYNEMPSFANLCTDCFFTNNIAAERGGAVYDGAYSNCTFSGNATTSSSVATYGGAACFSLTGGLYRCTFADNVATNGRGGALALMQGGSKYPHVEGCHFIRNRTISNEGGAIFVNVSALPHPISGCTFVSNCSERSSGGAVFRGSYTNCVFAYNLVSNALGGAAYFQGNKGCYAHTCAFIGNVSWTSYGGAVFCDPVSPFTDCVFTNNYAWKCGGALYRGCCTNCTFVGNRCVDPQGASIWSDTSANTPYLFNSKAVNCRFIENYRRDNTGRYSGQHTEFAGGDVLGARMENCEVIGGAGSFWRCSMVNCHLHHFTNTLGHCVFGEESFVTNCLVDNCRMDRVNASLFNRAVCKPSTSHRGLYRGEWVNCTFADNTLHNTRGMFNEFWYDEDQGPKMMVDLKNCIFYNNRKADGTLADISGYNAYDVTFSNCVYGASDGTLKYGTTNGWTNLGGTFVCADPLFAKDRAAKLECAYYTPRASSPVLGKGDASFYTDTDVDLAGKPRLKEGKVDLGAYQSWVKTCGFVLFLR